MPDEQTLSSSTALKTFFETSETARKAAAPLKKGAEVGVRFTDEPGAEHRFWVEDGKPRFAAGKAKDPDFDLTLAPGAVRAIVSQPNAEVGDLGIAFFQAMVASDPQNKARVQLHNGLIKLTMRGYLGVLALGGGKVMGWMAQKGLKGPSAVAAAISKLKKG